MLRFKSAAAPVTCAIYPSGQAVIKVDVGADIGTLAESEAFACDIDLAQVTEVWRYGSLISSWLLDLTAGALWADPGWREFSGQALSLTSFQGNFSKESAPNLSDCSTALVGA